MYHKLAGTLKKLPGIAAKENARLALTITFFCLFSLILVITFFWYEHWTAFTADFKQFRNFCPRLVWDGRLPLFFGTSLFVSQGWFSLTHVRSSPLKFYVIYFSYVFLELPVEKSTPDQRRFPEIRRFPNLRSLDHINTLTAFLIDYIFFKIKRNLSFASSGANIVARSAHNRVKVYAKNLRQHFAGK